VTRIDLVTADRFAVGESPVWDKGKNRLYWTDIPAGNVHALDLDGGARHCWHFAEPVASMGLCRSGRLVLALRDNVELFAPESGRRQVLAHIAHAKPGMRLNDGKVGPDGNFWVGSMDASADGAPAARLYRITPDGAISVVAEGLAISNGLAWNAQGTLLYHSDSRGAMWIDIYDFDPASGTTGNRRRLAEVGEALGRADGGACDMAGNYWSCGPSQSRINRFSPEGRLLDWIALPTLRPTMPCFGGKDMRTLFVTSLSAGIDAAMLAAHPQCGAIVSFRAPVAGVPVARFDDLMS